MVARLRAQLDPNAGHPHKFSEKFIAPLRTFVSDGANTGATNSRRLPQDLPPETSRQKTSFKETRHEYVTPC